MFRSSLAVLSLLGLAVLKYGTAAAAEPARPDVQKVFGREAPGPYKHPACIGELDNGDLLLVYYGGEGEYAVDTKVYGSRRKSGEKSWSPPQIIADTPFRSEGNAVVWQAPDGIVWLYYVVRYGDTWSSSRIQAKISRDRGQTWSDPQVVAWQEGMMVRNRPIVLADGCYLLPVYHETGSDIEVVGADSTSLFLRYDPKTHQWSESNRIGYRLGCLQPAVAALSDEHLVCYCRRGGGYGPRSDGYLVRSESTDGGRTWAPGKDSQFPNPNSAVDFIKLANGHLLLVYNDSMVDRTPLSLAISTDGDKSYPHRRNLMTGDDDFAYPIALQGKDGRIYVVFTSQERTQINLAVLDETWVLAGSGK